MAKVTTKSSYKPGSYTRCGATKGKLGTPHHWRCNKAAGHKGDHADTKVKPFYWGNENEN